MSKAKRKMRKCERKKSARRNHCRGAGAENFGWSRSRNAVTHGSWLLALAPGQAGTIYTINGNNSDNNR